MEAKYYNEQGKVAGTITLPERVFGARYNPDLIHQVVVGMQGNARARIAHTKDRGEVRGGGKKPWQQKGTGRARHGSSRSPLWRSGGTTFGPRNERDFSRKINKKMRSAALCSILSRKLSDNEIIFLEAPAFSEPKTARAKAIVSALMNAGFDGFKKKRNAALFALGEKAETLAKSFRNLGHVSAMEARSINPIEILGHKYVVFVSPEAALEALASRMGQGESAAAAPSAKAAVKAPAAKKRAAAPKKRVSVKKTAKASA